VAAAPTETDPRGEAETCAYKYPTSPAPASFEKTSFAAPLP